jgi:hypothetical protein
MVQLRPEIAPHRHFSPFRDAQQTCATCRHSIGYDGTHLWCESHRIVVVMSCGVWEREPGTEP